MSELLASRAFTDEERAAHDAAPRPGWCWHLLRQLTQDETDVRIRRALLALAAPEDRDELARLVGPIPARELGERMAMQYGGLDSDPLLRVLALRAWGQRDMLFSFERGIRRDDPVQLLEGAESLVSCAQLYNPVLGTAMGDAGPGAWIEIAIVGMRAPYGPRLGLGYLASPMAERPGTRDHVIRPYRVADVPRGGPIPAYADGWPIPRV